MLLRELLVEKSLSAVELYHRGDFLHLRTLIDLVNKDYDLPVNPLKIDKLGDTVRIDKSEIPAFQAALDSGNIKANIPTKIKMHVNGKLELHPISVIFKGKEFTSADGTKTYNTGHLAELFMGLCVAAKFLALTELASSDEKIRAEQIMDMLDFVNSKVDGKNYVFSVNSGIQFYAGTRRPDLGGKVDTLNFLARIPFRSAEAFLNQARAKKFDPELQAVLASAIKYVNSSASVKQSVERVRRDKNNNHVDIISDGTSDAKGTKADLTLKVDGTKINLLSLKTYSSDTLGQTSGLTFLNLKKWFDTNFELDINDHKDRFDLTVNAKSPAITHKGLLKFYDDVVFPYVEKTIENQRPDEEAAIVKQLARAANIYARGDSLEDVEIVKLDDKISKGGYKILKFTDSLDQAMQRLDLDVKYINKGESRTIQIWTVPAEGKKIVKGRNKLCQFRTGRMGGYTRNFFETGPMLEALTEVGRDASIAPIDVDSETTPGGTTLTRTSEPRDVKLTTR